MNVKRSTEEKEGDDAPRRSRCTPRFDGSSPRPLTHAWRRVPLWRAHASVYVRTLPRLSTHGTDSSKPPMIGARYVHQGRPREIYCTLP